MKKYVFEITLTEESLQGDELWESIMDETNSEGVAEISEGIQQALMGEYAFFVDKELAKEAVKLKSFTDI